MGRKKGDGAWKKGVSGNPKGRAPFLTPELQLEINTQKAAVKKLIMLYMNMTEEQVITRQRDNTIPFIEKMLGQCLERICIDGDVDKFRKILEIVMGRIPEDKSAMDLSIDEQMMILTYRKRLLHEQSTAIVPVSSQDHTRIITEEEPTS